MRHAKERLPLPQSVDGLIDRLFDNVRGEISCLRQSAKEASRFLQVSCIDLLEPTDAFRDVFVPATLHELAAAQAELSATPSYQILDGQAHGAPSNERGRA